MAAAGVAGPAGALILLRDVIDLGPGRFPLNTTEEMELCSIEDAFPNIETGTLRGGKGSSGSGLSGSGLSGSGKGSGFPFVGGTDDRPSREERRAARKKAKRCKGPAGAYSDATKGETPDPDRPAAIRMKDVEAFVAGGAAGMGRGLDEEDPEATAAGGEQPVHIPTPLAKQAPRIPILPKASCLFSDAGYPSYFGKSEDDEEGFSSFSAAAGDDPNYRLEPDFTKTFEYKGAQKAAGGALPAPNLEDSWKPMTAAASYTAFTPVSAGSASADGWTLSLGEPVAVPGGAGATAAEPARGGRIRGAEAKEIEDAASPVIDGVVPAGGNKKEDRDMLLSRVDALIGRLETLEKKKKQDTQSELLMFVGTGLFLLLSFEVVSRR